jgi:hypothetical protein
VGRHAEVTIYQIKSRVSLTSSGDDFRMTESDMVREKVNSIGKSPLAKALIVLLMVVFLPILFLIAIVYGVWSVILSVAIWIVWGLRGRHILFIYSDSPIWSAYIQQEVLPHILQTAVLLNWSGRKQWKISLAVLAFKLYGGSRDFNPMAIVFRPFRFHKIFRFYRAFKDFKHGKIEPLEKIRLNFLQLVKR